MITLNIHDEAGEVQAVHLPEDWAELDGAGMARVAAVLFSEGNQARFAARMLAAVTGLAGKMLDAVASRLPEDWPALLSWTRTPPTEADQKTATLRAGHWGRRYDGPKGHLRNIRMHEFGDAERALWEWQQAPDEDALLYAFVATLYRPRKRRYDVRRDADGDPRAAYNPNLTAHYACRLQRWCPRAGALAVVLWYRACRDFMGSRHPRIFPRSEVKERTTETPTPSYYLLLRAVAEKGIYGSFDNVEQMYVYTLLHELEAALDEAENARTAAGVNPTTTDEDESL